MSAFTPAPNGYPIKLVRDRTPATINATGDPGELFYAPLADAADRGRWLRKKLVEEVGEYLIDGGPAELRDVLAVLAELAIEHGIGWDRLTQMVVDDPRGGFGDSVMMYGRHPEFDGGRDAA
jgi:predicted house-cleaning noncanonical NTP pyrophosphatase (MazG superfamily)